MTPDLEDLISDSEPNDLGSEVLEEQTDYEDVQLDNGSRRTSTPNASLLPPSQQSFAGTSGDGESFTTLLRETNDTVKRFDARLASLEAKVEAISDKEKSTASAQEKEKLLFSDQGKTLSSTLASS